MLEWSWGYGRWDPGGWRLGRCCCGGLDLGGWILLLCCVLVGGHSRGDLIVVLGEIGGCGVSGWTVDFVLSCCVSWVRSVLSCPWISLVGGLGLAYGLSCVWWTGSFVVWVGGSYLGGVGV